MNTMATLATCTKMESLNTWNTKNTMDSLKYYELYQNMLLDRAAEKAIDAICSNAKGSGVCVDIISMDDALQKDMNAEIDKIWDNFTVEPSGRN